MPELPSAGLLLDILLILAVAGLWLAWWRNLNRLCKTERLLAESIAQLDQASSELQQAAAHIRAFEKRQQKAPAGRPRPAVKKQTAAAEPAEEAAKTALTRTLRLKQQGKSAEEIADILNLPITQVRLMLKVHGARVA